MDVKDFMPDEAVIAGIKADLERYEAERSRTRWAVRWRVVLFQGLLLAAILALALLFNRFADPNEQWLSAPHVMLYVVGFFAAIVVQIAATSPARRLQQSFRERIIPLIFGFIEGSTTAMPRRRARSSGCRARRSGRSTTSNSTTSSPAATKVFPSNSTRRRCSRNPASP